MKTTTATCPVPHTGCLTLMVDLCLIFQEFSKQFLRSQLPFNIYYVASFPEMTVAEHNSNRTKLFSTDLLLRIFSHCRSNSMSEILHLYSCIRAGMPKVWLQSRFGSLEALCMTRYMSCVQFSNFSPPLLPDYYVYEVMTNKAIISNSSPTFKFDDRVV